MEMEMEIRFKKCGISNQPNVCIFDDPCLSKFGALHGVSKRGRDTEFDANIQLEEMLTFFSNEYKVCINIFSVFPLLCRVLSVITAEKIVTGDHA